ncbi:ABC transporter substrate-binding protein [Cellulomonas cellasea]|uniref:Simple sugar transport system substrate-binding protein/ribose transport system substrate-binding protein n=1 Tax=Cellulomonas cellasea TaxID=43670 RepID=A0A7W4UF39_9CELL|nr:ABC transporter substrate-binding protein [Cellulomonas cellasea]MBB2922413.1 simple sugar transport system substrate-binding protein/ribose transport system substrate-binding protein [Cellulomonas cellasea]
MVSRKNARHRLAGAFAGVAVLALGLTACGGGGNTDAGGDADAGGDSGSGDLITVGFAQVGAESGWRAANTKSIQDTLTKENGFDLKFSDAQQKQENQIQAIRSYIAQGVDVIAFSPVVESGWDAVLEEAKAADIPVVLTDRAVDSEDESLYVSFLGSDFVVEGEKAGQWVVDEFGDEEINIVELQGTTGSAPANDRKAGFESVIEGHDNLKIIASQTGNFTRSEGKTVMEGFLQANPDIDLVYAHNDDMGLGAMEAIEAAGKVPGVDIKIVTVDAVKDGMQALADGKFNFIVECSPLLGPQLAEIVEQVVAGETPEKRIITEETTFTQEQAKEALPDRQY